MENPSLIIPALLTASIEELIDQVKMVSAYVDKIHIDVVDGYFAPHITCCPAPQIAAVDFATLYGVSYEVHLMVENPGQQLVSWKKAGADRVIAHIEVLEDQEHFVEKASKLGLEVGLALKVETELSELDELVTPNLNTVLLMAHEIGVQGVLFDDSIVPKISELRNKYEHLNIQVDGGMTDETIRKSFDAGANIFAVGSTIVRSKQPKETIERLQSLLL